MKYTITSLLLFVLLTAGCNNQPQNTQNDIATPVSVTKLKKGSISKLVNTTGTAQPTYGVTLTNLQLFRRAPRAMTEIFPYSAVRSVKILSLSFVSVSRRTMPFVTM